MGPIAGRTRVIARATLLGLVATLLVVFVSLPGAAAGEERARRVVVFAMPYVSWAELDRAAIPNLDRFLRGAAVAGLSTRVDERRTPLGDGYATIGAGTRAVAAVDAEGGGLMTGERFGVVTAGDVYRQRTGLIPDGAIVETAIVPLLGVNSGLPYDADIGALADALGRAGLRSGVVANADGGEPDAARSVVDATPSPARQRQAVLGLMGHDGQVVDGRVDAGLLTADAAAPFGVRLDEAAVVDAFRAAWRDRSVVLVEASDLVRAARYRPYAADAEQARQQAGALRASDRLFGALLREVDTSRDLVVVLGPAHEPDRVTLTPMAIRGPGFGPGLLESATTRRAGFVQIQDVAPTILAALDVDRPSSMEGQPAEVSTTGGSVSERLADLRDADAAAQFRDDRIGEVYGLLVAATTIVVVAAIVVASRSRPARARGAARFLALWALGILSGAFLVRLVPLHEHDPWVFFVALLACGAAVAAACSWIGRRRPLDGLLGGLALIVVVLALDVFRGAPLVFNSVLGYSPTVAGRFAGFGNPAYAAFSAATLAVAALLAHRIGGSRGAAVAGAVLAAAVVIDVAPMWGSDIGGILSMVPAYVVTFVLMTGRRVRVRTALVAVGCAVVVAAVAALVDFARPAADRTHLGRLVERVRDNGIGDGWTVIERKLSANLATVGTSILGLVLLVAVIGALWCWYRHRDRIAAVFTRVPEWRAANGGFVVLAALGFALNDSGMTVPAIMLVVFVSAWAHLLVSMPPTAAADGTTPSGRENALVAVASS